MDARLTMVRSEDGLPEVAFRLPVLEPRKQQFLPFTVRMVRNTEQLDRAISIRQRAYGRHVPELAAQLGRPEPLDMADGCAVLLAESKLDGEPIGTMRIQTNRYRPLALEASATLPARFADCSLAEATRLGVALGRIGHVVRTALFKAFYLYCAQVGVEWMVIAGRAPLDRVYNALLFDDVFPGQASVPLKHAANIPHRILSLEVAAVEPKWRAANHALYDYFFRTEHPDMQLGGEEHAGVPVAPVARPLAVANA